MEPVFIFSLPHNHRAPLYNEGEAPSMFDDPDGPHSPVPITGEWLTLPAPMPKSLMLYTVNDRVVAARADDRRVRWKDLDTVVLAVQQYNRDCARARESV
jgi:hypothetical protein